MQRLMIRQSIKLELFNEKIDLLTEKHSDEPEILKEKKMDLIFKFKIFPLFTLLILVARLFGFIGITLIVAFSQLMVFYFPSDFASYEIIQISCPNLENNICDNTFMFLKLDLFSQIYEQPATSMLVLIGLLLTTIGIKNVHHNRENKKVYFITLIVELLFYIIFPIGLWIGKILSNIAVAFPISLYLHKTKEGYTNEIRSLYEKKYAIDSP